MNKTNTTKDWLKKRKWKEFLLSVPLDKPMGYQVENANDLYIIRVRASQLSTSSDCDRVFSVTTDYETRIITITAKLKNDGTV